MRDGFGGAAGLMQRLGFVQVGIRVIGMDVNGNAERVDGFVQAIQFGEQATNLRPSFQVIVVEFGRDMKPFEGRQGVALSVQDIGKMELNFGRVVLAHQA